MCHKIQNNMWWLLYSIIMYCLLQNKYSYSTLEYVNNNNNENMLLVNTTQPIRMGNFSTITRVM